MSPFRVWPGPASSQWAPGLCLPAEGLPFYDSRRPESTAFMYGHVDEARGAP